MSEFILSAFSDEIDKDLKIQMDVLQEHNIKYIEMRGVNGRNLVEHTLDEVREIKRQLDQRGFKISAVGSPIGKIKITDEFEPHLNLFKHTLEIAKILETQYIRMFSFFIPEGENPDKHREEVLLRWNSFIEAAKGTGIILLHENEKDIYGDTAERCFDLLKSLNCDYVKGIFDFANFVQCNEINYPKAYELLKDYIVYIHVKDAVYSDGHVVPAGDGDGKIPEILSCLRDKEFEGFLSLEPHLGDFYGFAALENNGTSITNNEKSGPIKFAVAANALKKVLKDIGVDKYE
jgi:sugar phosphate isomerase/epimerase